MARRREAPSRTMRPLSSMWPSFETAAMRPPLDEDRLHTLKE